MALRSDVYMRLATPLVRVDWANFAFNAASVACIAFSRPAAVWLQFAISTQPAAFWPRCRGRFRPVRRFAGFGRFAADSRSFASVDVIVLRVCRGALSFGHAMLPTFPPASVYAVARNISGGRELISCARTRARADNLRVRGSI
jgi:hypothetical protein